MITISISPQLKKKKNNEDNLSESDVDAYNKKMEVDEESDERATNFIGLLYC